MHAWPCLESVTHFYKIQLQDFIIFFLLNLDTFLDFHWVGMQVNPT